MTHRSLVVALLIAGSMAFAVESPIATKLTEATVFLNGAQLTRTASFGYVAGQQTFIISDLPQNINASSIQVTGKGDYTLLSVKHSVNFLKPGISPEKTKILQDSIKLLERQVQTNKLLVESLKEEQTMLLANKAIGGQNSGVNVAELKAAYTFFQTSLKESKLKIQELELANKEKEEILGRLRTRLNQQGGRNHPVSEVFITISAAKEGRGSLSLSYVIYDARWSALYDGRVTAPGKPVELTHKALVYQNSGEDWENVRLTLSTGNPQLSGQKPELEPWYLYVPAPPAPALMKEKRSTAGMPMKTMVMEDIQMEYDAAISEELMAAPPQVILSENVANIEYTIGIPVNIQSDKEDEMVEVARYALPATFQYHCAPKLDGSAFLMARVTGWEQYNLMAGQLSLFYEGTFVGQSYLDPGQAKDTLLLSLGRDQSIVVNRTRLPDYSSSRLIGSNKRESRGWKIEIRNNKKAAIELLIEDQIPVSTAKSIEVTDVETSGGQLDATNGKVRWRFALAPAETKTTELRYAVKFPADMPLVIY